MNRLYGFLHKDRKYVFLLGTLLSALGAALLCSAPARLSYLSDSTPLLCICFAVYALFALLALAAAAVKLVRRGNYKHTVFRRPTLVFTARLLFLLVAAALALTAVDRILLKLVCVVQDALAADTKPQAFFASMLYMFAKGKSMFALGVWTTVRIALFGTAIAFVLAIFMVFLRIQTPNKRDGDLLKFLKIAGSSFAKIYITVIRGTPMMVQAMIFYYAGFSMFKGTGMSVTEINEIWSFFTSGLITVSLNSTAYLAEVLRGGIEAVDPGQNEAARSLGMSAWQVMMKVVFPQGLKNSIPAIGNEFIINIKDSSVLSVIGVFDLMYATTTVNGIYYGSLPIYCVAAILYLILTFFSSLLMKGISKKLGTTAKDIPSSN